MHYNQLKSNKSLTCSNLTLLLSIYGPGSHILGRKGPKEKNLFGACQTKYTKIIDFEYEYARNELHMLFCN